MQATVILLVALMLALATPPARTAPGAGAKASPAPSATPKLHASKLAPADEYFGPLKMSPLGIRMEIGALGRRFNDRLIADGDVLHQAHDLEVALEDWRKKFAEDEWLAPTAFHLEQLYQAVQTKEARSRATAMLRYVIKYFPATKYGHMSRVRLAQGFPPLHEEPPLRLPTPTPSPAPTDSPSPAASESPSPEASGSPSPAASAPASPATRASPSAAASPAPANPPPPAPSPSAAPTASPPPSSAPTASPPPSAAPSLLPSTAPSAAPR